MIYALRQKVLRREGAGHYIAENATVVGDVVMKGQSSVWFGAVVRADNDLICIGERSNIQDGAVLHTDEGLPLNIGSGVTVGHKAVLHGCTIRNNSLIGINAIVLNGATVGSNCLIGAGALITENMIIPDGSLVLGSPGKIKRALTNQEVDSLRQSAEHYCGKAKVYNETLRHVL